MGRFDQDAGVTPYSFPKDILGFLMTTESQDLGLTSHPKDVIISKHNFFLNLTPNFWMFHSFHKNMMQQTAFNIDNNYNKCFLSIESEY